MSDKYDRIITSESVKDALDHLDSLTIVLNERYEEKEKKENLKTIKNNFKAKSPSPMHFLNNGDVIKEGVLFLPQYLTQDGIPLLILLLIYL